LRINLYSNYCEILGVPINSDIGEIKKAYRNKAKLYHPDVNSSPDASQEFIKIKRAFDYLSYYNIIYKNRRLYYNKSHSLSRYPTYRKKSFDRGRYKDWRAYTNQFGCKTKNEIDFKTTIFGKIVFYFFHLLFFLIGLYIFVGPLILTVINGIDPGKTVIETVFILVGTTLFGITMVIMILLSGLSINIPFRIWNFRFLK